MVKQKKSDSLHESWWLLRGRMRENTQKNDNDYYWKTIKMKVCCFDQFKIQLQTCISFEPVELDSSAWAQIEYSLEIVA